MIPDEIITIISKYKPEVAEEISSINLAINKISDNINSISSVLIDELGSYAKNTGTNNIDKELELLKDSQKLRDYVQSLKPIMFKNKPMLNSESTKKDLDIFDIIVLSNTLKCSYSNHVTNDIIADIPVLYENGEVATLSIPASYCKDCKRYTILKDDFKRINGNIMCKVIDETTFANSINDDEIDIEVKKSLLFQYGYNVQSKANLSSKQRHIILASVIEAELLNRRQITDHLTTLIERGNKIPKWKDATDKWKEDKNYVQQYKTENLPHVIFDRIILKYKKS